MGFKFLNNDNLLPIDYEDFERERRIERLRNMATNRRNEMSEEELEYHRGMAEIGEMLHIEEILHTTRLSVDNRPAVFLNLMRDRDTISEQEWNNIIQRQRTILIEHMFQQGMVIHTVISQDENGLTLRTELLF